MLLFYDKASGLPMGVSNSLNITGPSVGTLALTKLPDDFDLKAYVVKNNVLTRKREEDWSKLKIAMISVYGINCGIATYTKSIVNEMRGLVKELRIFAEHTDSPSCDDIKENVVRCWNRGRDYSRILPAIEEYNPDIIYIQHEYGNFPHGAKWNVLMTQLARWRVITVLHSVYEHEDKLIFEAANQEVIIHSPLCLDILRKKGFTYPIHLIPHGNLPVDTRPIYNSLKNEHSLFQFGFGFEYKGWETSIEVVERLKKIYPDIVYIGIFNISKFSEEFQNRYYFKLLDDIKRKGLENNIALIKGYQPESVLMSYIKQSRVGIFPYRNHPQYIVYGASGAIRLPLITGLPMVLSDYTFFVDLKDYTPVCKTVDDYATSICRLFEDKDYYSQVRLNLLGFAEQRLYSNTAKWYLSCRPDKDFNYDRLCG